MRDNNSLLCVGLDPNIDKIPWWANGIFDFCRWIADETHDLVCAFKPQIAYFAWAKAEDQLEKLIAYINEKYPNIPVILDYKRGDIGETASQYAKEAFERYNADAVTANPYMWSDTLKPYMRDGKWVFVLCKTSNSWSGDFQDLRLENWRTLYEEVAFRAKETWSKEGNVGLVVGATHPEQARNIRAIVGDEMIFLVPWVGAQWADVKATIESTKNSKWAGIIVNSSRAILYPKDWQTSRQVAMATRDEINQYR